jgi:hypothetical protein
MVTETSYNAYLSLKESGLLNDYEEKVLTFIQSHPNAYDLLISKETGISINNTCGRRNALMKSRIILKSGKVISKYTNLPVQSYEFNPLVNLNGLDNRLRIARGSGVKKGRQKGLKGFIL